MAQRDLTSSPTTRRWYVYPDPSTLTNTVARLLLESAADAIVQRGAFHLVLAGGSTPQALYRALAGASAEWAAWHIYYGDERCLPPDDPERNSHMAAQEWLSRVPIPQTQIHPIPAERGSEAGARAYDESLATVGIFDLVLLGLGEDGHVASLFPGHPLGEEPETSAALPVHDAPKPPPDRISLSAQRLNHTRELWFLVSGAGKREAVERWREGDDIPAAHIRPAAGVDVHMDSAAAPAGMSPDATPD
jgi:6-phosphogluconolactonase